MTETPTPPAETRLPRVLSGIQSSGTLHLGNYLGAVRNWVQDQAQYHNIFMIADYHALTSVREGVTLRRYRRELAAMLLAGGIDPQRSVLFYQSSLPEHTELGWVLTALTPLGWLERMTQFKDKSKGDYSGVSTGLLTYPCLQAADILLYQAEFVPVGEDQRQHIELTRDIAQRFNHLYGDVFMLPKALIRHSGARVMSLNNPLKKMSKSADDSKGRIDLTDSVDIMRKKIMSAVTDSSRDIRFSTDPERAGVNNLLDMYRVLTGETAEAIEAFFAGKGYGDLKAAAADAVIGYFEPIQRQYTALMADRAYLDQLMVQGAEKATAIARPTLQKVRRKIGM
jgi:tryptophanyl-tRNA synthetase